MLADHDLPPQALQLEVTESMTCSIQTARAQRCGGSAELGVRISVDDFGIGLLSLRSFSAFPIDELKIDQTFVTQMLHDESEADHRAVGGEPRARSWSQGDRRRCRGRGHARDS